MWQKIIYTYTGRNLTKVESNYDITDSAPGRKTYNYYDNYDRMIAVVMDPPLSGDSVTVAAYTYDSLGRRLTATDADGLVTSYMYDILGRLAWIQEPGKTTKTCYFYDALGRKTEERAAAGGNCAVVPYQTAVTSYLYDGLGRLVSVADPGNNTTDYEYDGQGNITQVTDARENVTTYSYNLLSQLVSTTNALSKTTSYTYDYAGRLIEKDDPKGQKTLYTYSTSDYLAFFQKIEYKDSSNNTEKIRSFKRDAEGQMTAYCDTGLISGSDCTVTTPTNPVYEYVYDALGRAVTVTNNYLADGSGNPMVIDYYYNRFGRRTKFEVIRNSVSLIHFDYGYDAAGRLASVTDNNFTQNNVIGFEYTESGRMAQINHTNGTYTEFGYNQNTGQIASIHHFYPDDSNLLSLAYTYDSRNNIASKAINSATTTYSYDLKNQLTGVAIDSSPTESFTYDAVGNRLSYNDIDNWSYNAGNQLEGYDEYEFTYDDKGNMITDGTQSATLTYSVDDRLVEFSKTGTTAYYVYDMNSSRVKKEVNSTATYYIYDGTLLLGELDGSKNLSKYYIFSSGYYPLEIVVKEEGDWVNYTYHNDSLGTPQRVTDDNGTVVWSGDYKAFGDLTETGNFENSLRFPGQWNDEESGLNFNQWRYYIASTGRYNSIDPLFNNENINIMSYTYSNENPIIFIDPDGLDTQDNCTAPDKVIIAGIPVVREYPSLVNECKNSFNKNCGDFCKNPKDCCDCSGICQTLADIICPEWAKNNRPGCRKIFSYPPDDPKLIFYS